MSRAESALGQFVVGIRPFYRVVDSFSGSTLNSALLGVYNNIAKLRGHPMKRKRLRGTVQKIIKPISPDQPEKAQINIEEGDDLYREIRIENVLTDEKGEKVSLKPGKSVDVVIEAESSATTKKP